MGISANLSTLQWLWKLSEFWRVTNLKANSGAVVDDADVEHEIHYQIKNVGSVAVTVDVYASVVS
jgi:hypothetical protein